MCCPTTHTTKSPQFMGMTAQDCGCGCLGNAPTKTELEKYRDHLKVELKSIEKQIQNLQEA